MIIIIKSSYMFYGRQNLSKRLSVCLLVTLMGGRRPRFCIAILCCELYQKPAENPPGGTRDFESPDPCWGGAGWLLGAADSAAGAACDSCWTGAAGADSGTGAAVCRTFSFASMVPHTKAKLDEFCWLFLGRGLMGHASGSPKMFEWPPPGGFNTRELFFSPMPLYKFVVVILSLVLSSSLAQVTLSCKSL